MRYFEKHNFWIFNFRNFPQFFAILNFDHFQAENFLHFAEGSEAGANPSPFFQIQVNFGNSVLETTRNLFY